MTKMTVPRFRKILDTGVILRADFRRWQHQANRVEIRLFAPGESSQIWYFLYIATDPVSRSQSIAPRVVERKRLDRNEWISEELESWQNDIGAEWMVVDPMAASVTESTAAEPDRHVRKAPVSHPLPGVLPACWRGSTQSGPECLGQWFKQVASAQEPPELWTRASKTTRIMERGPR